MKLSSKPALVLVPATPAALLASACSGASVPAAGGRSDGAISMTSSSPPSRPATPDGVTAPPSKPSSTEPPTAVPSAVSGDVAVTFRGGDDTDPRVSSSTAFATNGGVTSISVP